MQSVLKLLLFLAALATASNASAGHSGSWVQAFEISPAIYTMSKEVPKEAPPEYHVNALLHGTLRYRFAVAIAGSQVRLKISNELGGVPLSIGGASIGQASKGMDVVPSTLRRLTFGGKPGISIPAGAPALSDPVQFPVAALDELVASVFVDQDIHGSPMSGTRMLRADGDAVMDPSSARTTPVIARPIISGLLVQSALPSRVVVGLGDSITDGQRSDPERAHGWADLLARRFAARRRGPTVSVVSAGISGNRLLRDGFGPSALSRADRDVFAVPGVSAMVVLLGTNDIGMGGRTILGDEPALDPVAMFQGYTQLAVRAHARGIKIYAATITPSRGGRSFSEANGKLRREINDWLRTSPDFDGVIDFEAAIRDPTIPDRILPAFDSGDHVHPNDAGYKAMADAIPLSLFD